MGKTQVQNSTYHHNILHNDNVRKRRYICSQS